MHEKPRTPRAGARAVVLTAVAVLVLALPAAAQAQREIDVDPAGGISALGQAIEVSGTGYEPADHPNGFYVAQAAIVDEGETEVVRYGNAVLVHPSPTSPTQLKLEADGSFRGDLEVAGTFTQRDGPTVDCSANQCSVVSWQARTVPLPPGATPGPGRSVIYNSIDVDFVPAVVASPRSALDRGGQRVAVEGAGFPTAFPGIYVAQTAIVDGQVVTGDGQWIRPGGPTPEEALGADGTFESVLDLELSIGEGPARVDCSEVQCAVSTWTGHTTPVPPGATPGSSQSPITATHDVFFEIPVTVTPAAVPDTGPSKVTVRGQVPPALSAPGIYVAFGERAYPFWVEQDAFASAAFVPATAIAADGSFETEIEVLPGFAPDGGVAVDCTAVECGVYTMRAHALSQIDRRLDSYTAVDFVTPEPDPDPKPKPGPEHDPGPDPRPATGKAARFTQFKKARKPSRRRIARIGRVSCESERPCRVVAPKRVKIRIGKREVYARVLVRKRIAAGKHAVVRVKLGKRVARLLAKRRGARGKVTIIVASTDALTAKRRLRVRLAGGGQRGGRGSRREERRRRPS